MHDRARQFLESVAQALELMGPQPGPYGLELGAYDRNGSARDLWPDVTWTGLDLVAGPGVDIVADARWWDPATDHRCVRPFDIVLCTELLEHVAGWGAVIDTAAQALRPGGLVVITAAGPARDPHTAAGAPMPFPPPEHYAGIPAATLRTCLELAGFPEARVWRDSRDFDVYAMGWKADG